MRGRRWPGWSTPCFGLNGPMSTPGDRWAPFPVQDWSSMPPAEPWGATAEWSPPAAWAPPRDPRPRWLPLLVVTLVTVLVAGGLFAAERVGGSTTQTTALAYLPTDGAVAYQQRETTIGSATTTQPLVSESARLTGAALLSGLDFTLGSRVLAVTGADRLDRTRFWRTTTGEIGTVGSGQQLVRVYRTDAAVELIAESGPGGADVYAPALVELPAAVRAGDRWSGEGLLGAGRYRSELRAEPAGDCLRAVGTLTRSTTAGQVTSVEKMEKTWCPTSGVNQERTVRSRVTTTVRAASRPAADPALRTVTEPWTWGDPVGWKRRDYDLMSTDSSLGSGIMTGAPSQVVPVMTASGLMVRATSSDDLVALTPKTAEKWVSLWRMHPGGTVLSLAAFGDVLVATTSRRQVVGYSDAGIRLWSLDLTEVAFQAPVRVTDRQIALVDSAGTVSSVDLLRGEVGWTHDVGAQVSAPLVASGRAVVVFDQAGTTTALNPATGVPVWTADLDGEVGTVLGGTLVVRSDATLEGIDLDTGRYRWLVADTGVLDALRTVGDTVVVSTQLRTVVLSEDGRLLDRLPPYEWVTVVGPTMVGWGAKEAQIRDADRTLLRTIDTPDVTLTSSRLSPLAYRHGVFVLGPGWTFTGWSDEP